MFCNAIHFEIGCLPQNVLAPKSRYFECNSPSSLPTQVFVFLLLYCSLLQIGIISTIAMNRLN